MNKKKYYINDEVVNKFFDLLKRRYEKFPHKYLKHHSFDSATAAWLIDKSKTEAHVLKGLEKEDLKDVAKLFVPMCLHEHWILFYADIDAKKLVWLDPLEHTRVSKLWEKHVIQRLFLEFILPSLGHDLKDWSFDVPNNIPSQKNSVDCALFVMKYADCLTHGNYLPFTQDDMPHFRHRTLLDLYHGSLCLGKGQSY
ncbi:UB-like protease 1B [Hibiscus trionum]|uniref:UB-like protease 1B n=1 Tax=Hibiscus trionum TaxID=183268 RepID=A0A9W7IMS5_HIBTR|nr:UB-like protease 1B [Hibiscus trionum]